MMVLKPHWNCIKENLLLTSTALVRHKYATILTALTTLALAQREQHHPEASPAALASQVTLGRGTNRSLRNRMTKSGNTAKGTTGGKRPQPTSIP